MLKPQTAMWKLHRQSTHNCTTLKRRRIRAPKGGRSPKSKAAPATLTDPKANLEKAMKAVQVAKLVIMMEGAKAFELHGDLLACKAR